MNPETEGRLAAALSERADEMPFGDAPLAAIRRESARLDRRRRRLVTAGAACVAATVVAAGAVAALSDTDGQAPAKPLPYPSDLAPRPAPGPLTPSPGATAPPDVPTAAPTAAFPPAPDPAIGALDADAVRSAMRWPTRGSLRGDPAVLDAARARLIADSATGKGVLRSPDDAAWLDVTVWYAADTPAGRIVVVGATVNRPGASAGADIVVWAGPTGTPIADLRIVGNVVESLDADMTLSRLIETPGGWWLFAMSAPGADAAKVSWHPQFDNRGPAPRTWVDVGADDGVVLTPAPGRAVAARIALLRGGTVAEQPVIEDSHDLDDPSFLPPGPTPDSAPVIEWLAARLALPLGVSARDLAVNEVAYGRGTNGHANTLLTVRLPSGAVLVALVADRPVPDGPPLRSLMVAVAPGAVAAGDEAGGSTDTMVRDRVWTWIKEDRVTVAAPSAPDTEVRLNQPGSPPRLGTLDADGFADLPVRPDLPVAGVTVEVAQAKDIWRPSVTPSAKTHTDPFNLRD
ncbi:hypothetical protein [Streptodolium elevatio]|uniref:Uncharacterized protein n=1 Tax=Streptodolium elevatio TaxID=3157996 RepID=A0ABV3DKV0_9ACTN